MSETDLLKWQIDDFQRTGGPVHPGETEAAGGGTFSFTGMTLRDWFAGKALDRLIDLIGIPEDGPDELWDEHTARRAYAIADAMIKHRAHISQAPSPNTPTPERVKR